MTTEALAGVVLRVNGPLVEVGGLRGAVSLFDLVEVGDQRLPGEVVAIGEERLTVQVYEYTGGIAPGAGAWPTGGPLSASLGPWLLGGVFDGLVRPLLGGPVWLGPGVAGAQPGGVWPVVPSVRQGQDLPKGAVIGTARDPAGREHPIPLPPGLSGAVAWVAPAGEFGPHDRLAVVAGVEVALSTRWPVRRARPAKRRLEEAIPLTTGQRVLDLLEPLAKGSTAAVVGGFGTGKTVLLGQLARWCDADVIVYVGCGERGNELADSLDDLGNLEDPRTGRRLSERTVIIANTSNMPVMAREASIYAAMTVAEYFRDLGNDVVLIADSTSRWAEALREFSSRSGELPAEEGYPASLPSALAAFYERAGRVETLGGKEGSVTVVAAVSPPGGDVTEPVTSHTQRFVRALWTLDRDLAYARHYPAVSWGGSFSRDAGDLAAWYVRHGDDRWAARRARLASLLAEADRIRPIAELVGLSALPGRERIALLAARLVREAVLQQSALSANDGYAAPAKQAALADAVLAVHDRAQELVVLGVPATLIEEADFGPVLRARDAVGPDDAAGVEAAARLVLAGLPGPPA
ncbi:MAG TPA: V-type ATP synthase subunit A [Actinomycetota bacterium]|nr:V-type ATP synthase subunit A [Actinomycetota bacterium]